MKKIVLVLILVLVPVFSWADEYVLVMSKDDSVCQHMLKIYNEDLRKHGKIEYDQHEEFTAIKWEEKKYYTTFPDGKKHYSMSPQETVLISRFDINNDGKEEVVVKKESFFKGISSENLYYFKGENADSFKNTEFDVYLLHTKAAGSIDSGPGNTYKLKELPQFLYLGIGDKESKAYYSLGVYLYLYPLFFKGTYYLDMKDEVPSDIQGIYSSRFLLILKYSKDNQPKDICYFLKTTNCKNNPGGGK